MAHARVYKSRLLKLADFLEKLPRKRFCFQWFVGLDWKGADDLSCGTTACALGWATTMPTFKRLGLAIHKGQFVNLVRLNKRGGPWGAATRLFGISRSESEYLFNPRGCPKRPNCLSGDATPKQVAKHIRQFVREKFA
jgi:hypothetical protein